MVFRRVVIGIFAILILHGLPAQIKFNVAVSDKHLKRVERAKDPSVKLKKYKRFYSKDSTKAAAKAWRKFLRGSNRDSLRSIGLWRDIKTHKVELLSGKYNINKSKNYLVDFDSFKPPKDSMDWAVQELARRGDFRDVQRVYEAYGQYDSSYLEQFTVNSVMLDSATLANRFNTKERLKSYLPEELVEESDFNVAKRMKEGVVDEYGNIKQLDLSGVSDFFNSLSPKEFARSQVSLKAAKEKYASISDLGEEDGGIKRKSLQGTPFKNRLFLNGNVTAQSLVPVIIDSNIQIGYMWNKNLSSGVGIMIREQLSSSDSIALTGDAHGLSLFASYDILKGFFIYSEYQLVRNKSLFQETSVPSEWQYSVLAGIGRKFNVSKKVTLSISLLYDFNYRNSTLSQRPIVPRIGYQIKF